MTDPVVRKLARQLVSVDKRLKDLETVPQLAHSSIDDGALPVYDKDGNLVIQMGKQDDGTWGAPPLAGPVPPAPEDVTATGGAGSITVSWGGEFTSGAAPRDFDTLEVLVDGTLTGAISDRDGGSVTVQAEPGTRYVSARIRTLVPRHSATTSPFSVRVGPPADELFAEARARIELAEEEQEAARTRVEEAKAVAEAAQGRLDELDETTLPAVRAELEAQAEAAQAEFRELDDRLANFATDDALSGLRGALEDARDVADAAQSAAVAADTAAKAASQAALEAAGIAASKGRVIVQEAEPTGADRQAANIWIKPIPDDPDTDIEEKAVTYVYLVDTDEWIPTTSDELAQAAQNALDAREAAQQAQQRADTAVSNAATAQAAAEAAQRTADAATLDARDAHNEAVAAQAEADAAQERINSGLNLVNNPTRTGTLEGWTQNQGDLSVVEKDMGNGPIKVMEHRGTGNGGVTGTYFDVDPSLAYEVRFSFLKPEVNFGSNSDFYFGAYGRKVSPGTAILDRISSDTGALFAPTYNVYFYSGHGPWEEPVEMVCYVLPLGTDSSLAKGLGSSGTTVLRFLETDTYQMVLRWLNYDNRDEEFPAWVGNVSVRATTVEDIVRAKEARDAAATAQVRAEEAYAEAARKLDEGQVKAVADASQAAAEATSRAEIEAAEARAAVEAARVAREEAEREAGEAEAAAKAYADLIDTGASDADITAARKYAEEQAEEARKAAEAAAALDATAKAETAEANAAADAKRKADQALADAKADATAKADAAEQAAKTAAAADATSKAEAAQAEAARLAALDATAKAEAAREAAEEAADAVAKAEAGAARTAAEAEAKRLADLAESAAKQAAAADATAKTEAAEARAATDAKTKADKALSDALAALATARGQITTEIRNSANGKNSITISTSAPSGTGLVVGDTWWRTDSAGDIYGQWAWDGNRWVARTIRSEVIANLDVNKLVVSGAASIDEAVINKLFAETFAAHKITADKLLVSGSQNLIPGVRPGSNYGLSNFEWDEEEAALRANGRQTVYADEAFTLVPGEYLVEADIKASVEGTRTYIGLLGGDDVPFLYRYGISNVQVSKEWQSFAANLTVGQGEGGSVQARFLPAYSGDTSATTWYRNVSIRQKVGSVLIEDGAISTPKLNVTEEMTAALVEAMDVATQRLIVSEEMIAYHATLLGETVVEQINVLGKLVGVDGVFTGTVDFSNINVTGEVLAEQIMAAQGLIAGNPGGERLELNNEGIVLYGLDDEGLEYEIARLGPSGENLLTIGDSTVSNDSISSPHGEFEDLTVGGDTLVDMLAALPRGRVAQNRYETWSQYSDAQQARLHVNFTYVPGRTYRVTMAPFFLETLSGTAEVEYRLIGKWDERSVGWADSEFAWARVDLTRSRVLLVPGLEGDWRWSSSYEREAHVTLMVWARSGNPVRMIQGSNYPAVLSVDDVGPELDYEGAHWTSGNRGDGSNQAPPTPAPSLRTATYTWGYGGFGGDISAGQIVQGVYPGVGERWGGWRFTAGQLSTLANMHSIIKFEVYLYADHWYYGSGGTAVIRANNGAYKTVSSEQVVVSGWKRGQGRWVSLPSSWFSSFLSRRWQGISVRANSSGLTQYGRFVPGRTKFRVRYRIRN